MTEPLLLQEFVQKSTLNGIKLFITAAPINAGLASAVASMTPVPVINFPLASAHLQNTEALFAFAQTPEGIPVSTMGFGLAGGRNAAILAAQILSVADVHLRERVRFFKQNNCRF